MSLKNTKVLLTGASRGVGYAAAKLLIESGASVFGIARNENRLKAAHKELNGQGPGTFDSFCIDLAAPSAPGTVASQVTQLWGSLDCVVHNAGVMLHHEGGILGEPEGILEQSLEINLMAPFRLTRALLPLLKLGTQPRIINVGSGAGTLAGLKEPGIASYRLSKLALHGLTMLQAEELKDVVSVHAFDPGWVRTDLGGPDAPGTAEEAAQGLLKSLLLPWNESGKFLKDGEDIPW